ncbi:flavin reductase (DIM6/NTAB) family NADH-FMN oxidoreductase RutF [Geomicrobium halophilum]|uniref:Flavin reductase (DIM6/NTAB) family NADH-FMN oxidoreductase RutF n=1 Tax=Geomicrobium halophilum TaxID=549000 RepID=A0A841PPM3_9BACL|nr:flavin reductase family protein [Geomicrobium halophilum]MBB6450720.1 flavin reductase (DIM6/NTAB) family NADH-FMN oxidoreductase RutF [Geomicrobium halophilum]
MDDLLFRQAMGTFSTGVTVISTEVDAKTHGMTANAFMSVSLDPKLVAVSVDHQASIYEEIRTARRYAVSILDDSQEEISKTFANQIRGKEQFAFATFRDLPVIPDALVHLACDVVQEIAAGDHTIFIGEVKDIEVNEEEGRPLLYYRGAYQALQ